MGKSIQLTNGNSNNPKERIWKSEETSKDRYGFSAPNDGKFKRY